MSATTSDRDPKPTRPTDLDSGEKELLRKSKKLGKIARYTGNALNVMLTVLKEASAGVPILRPVAGSALAVLETVQMLDDNQGLIALVLVDVVETCYVVTLALESSEEGREHIVEKKLSTYIITFNEKVKGIELKLKKLLKPKGGIFTLVSQVKGHKNVINDLHEELKKERANLHLLVSALTYTGTVCRLPVDHDELKEYAGKLASSQLQGWQLQQRENPNGMPAGAAAVVNSQVGTLTAKKATKNAIGTQGTIYNGDNCKGNNTVYNIAPRGETKRSVRVGTIGNYHDGDVYGTMNQGCNTMYFSPGHQSQEPVAQADWQQQQWSQGPSQRQNQTQRQEEQWTQETYPPRNQTQWQEEQWSQETYPPRNQTQWQDERWSQETYPPQNQTQWQQEQWSQGPYPPQNQPLWGY